MKRVDVDDVEWDDDLTAVYDGAPFTGEVVETTRRGEIIAVTTYENGRTNGPSTEWFPSGQLKARGTSRYGRAVGLHRVWHANGQLAEEHVFDDVGNLLTRQKWDESGNPIPQSSRRRA